MSDADKRAQYNGSLQPATAPAAPLARAERHARAAAVCGVDLVRIGLWCLLLLIAVRVGNETAGGAAQLTIRNVSLLVGSFDSPVLLAHIGRHRQRLIHDLTARLAREDPHRLARPEGERHLRRVVLEAAAASLDTDLAQEYPSTYFESPGRYGVVDVLLPEGFKLSFN